MKKSKEKSKFLQKIQRFIEEYVTDCNATQAAIRAGYSVKTAYSQGCRLLKNDEVKKEIDRLLEEKTKQSGVTAEYVIGGLQRLADICSQRMPIMVKKGNEMVHKVDENGNKLYTAVDSVGATRALELLGKNLKLFTEKFDHTSNGQTLSSFFSAKPDDLKPIPQREEE